MNQSKVIKIRAADRSDTKNHLVWILLRKDVPGDRTASSRWEWGEENTISFQSRDEAHPKEKGEDGAAIEEDMPHTVLSVVAL